MSTASALSAEHPTGSMGCSPVMMLRLLAMADDPGTPTVIDEPEQLMLPLEWAWPVPKRVEPEPLKPSERPDPRHWGGRVALAAFEIMIGDRSANQLARLVDSRTLHVLAMNTSKISIERRRLRNVVPGRPRVTSVRCYQPHPDAAEITAVVHDGLKFRAVAMRLSARGGQWLATAFEMG